MIKVMTIILMAVLSSTVVCAEEMVLYNDFTELEALLLSPDLTCDHKQKLAYNVSMPILKELFDRLGAKNVILRKARERNELMNTVFAYEGEHEWSRSDMRVLRIVFTQWREMMVPECFDPRTSGFSSTEWLKGARWAIEHQINCVDNLTINMN